MLQKLEKLIQNYEPTQQETLRYYALKMNDTAKRQDIDGFRLYGLIFASLCENYAVRNALKKVTG